MAASPSSRSSTVEFCLNIMVHNKERIVEKHVSEKLGPAPDQDPLNFHKLAQDVVGKIANDFISEEEVTKSVAESVMAEIPMQLRQTGITAETSLCFLRGSFAVVEVQILGVDFTHLASQGIVAPAIAKIISCFRFLPALLRNALYGQAVLKVAMGTLEQLPDKVIEDLQERGGVEASVKALPYEDEAIYLFAVISELTTQGGGTLPSPQGAGPLMDFKKALQDFTGQDHFGDVTNSLLAKTCGKCNSPTEESKSKTL